MVSIDQKIGSRNGGQLRPLPPFPQLPCDLPRNLAPRYTVLMTPYTRTALIAWSTLIVSGETVSESRPVFNLVF